MPSKKKSGLLKGLATAVRKNRNVEKRRREKGERNTHNQQKLRASWSDAKRESVREKDRLRKQKKKEQNHVSFAVLYKLFIQSYSPMNNEMIFILMPNQSVIIPSSHFRF